MGFHALLQGIFPTQRSNPGLLHCRQILYHFSEPPGGPFQQGEKGAEGCGEEVQLALLGISALPTTSDFPHLSTHNGYYSAVKKKHEVLTFAETQMDFEGTMLSEISQTEKDKYCMISLISEI